MRRTPIYLHMNAPTPTSSNPYSARVHVDEFFLTVIRYYTGVIPDTGDIIASKNHEDIQLVGAGSANSWSGCPLNTDYRWVTYYIQSGTRTENLY